MKGCPDCENRLKRWYFPSVLVIALILGGFIFSTIWNLGSIQERDKVITDCRNVISQYQAEVYQYRHGMAPSDLVNGNITVGGFKLNLTETG